MKTFDGDVTIMLSPTPGLELPEKVVILKARPEWIWKSGCPPTARRAGRTSI